MVLVESALTPYILALASGAAAAVAWLFKESIAHGKNIVRIESALKYYFEVSGKGLARELDSPNPTPPEIRVLLKKYYHEEEDLTPTEMEQLREWLRMMQSNMAATRDERSIARQLLATIGASRRLAQTAK